MARVVDGTHPDYEFHIVSIPVDTIHSIDAIGMGYNHAIAVINQQYLFGAGENSHGT